MKKIALLLLLVVLGAQLFPLAAFAGVQEPPGRLNEKYNALQKLGIFEGFEDGNPRLTEDMTREQLAKILALLWHLEPETGYSSYNDVLADRWSSGYIEAVTTAGMMNGMGNDLFDPAGKVTYEQLAAVFVRGLGLPEDNTTNLGSKLGKVSEWARGYVVQAIMKELIFNQDDFAQHVLRADLVTATYQANTLLQLGSSPTPTPTPPAGITVTEAKAVSATQISVTFSDGVTQLFSKTLAPGVETSTTIAYKGKSHTITVTWTPPEQPAVEPMPQADPNEPASPDLFVNTAAAAANGVIKVIFVTPVDRAPMSNFSLQDSTGNPIPLRNVYLQNPATALLYTDPLAAGATYTLRVVSKNDYSGSITPPLADAVKPSVSSVSTNPNGTVNVQYTEPMDPWSIGRQEAYAIPSLEVTRVIVADDGKSAMLTTSAQTSGVRYNVTFGAGITDLSGNELQLRSSALGFAGVVDRTKPQFQTVSSVDGTHLKAVFSEELDETSAETTANYQITGGLTVTAAELASDRKSVLLTVSPKQSATSYTLTADQVKDLSGNAIDKTQRVFYGNIDSVSPTATLLSSLNGDIKLKFSEKMARIGVETLGNYTIRGLYDNSLTLSVVKIFLDKDDMTLTLKTTPQTSNMYTLTMQNMTDPAGNALIVPSGGITFAGYRDYTPPAIDKIVQDNGIITIYFNEKLEPVSAQTASNYRFDGSAAASASYDDSIKAVRLTTSGLTPGRAYLFAVSGVKDLSDNVLNTNRSLAISNPFTLQSIVGLGPNTVDLHFSRQLTASEASAVVVTMTKANNAAWNTSGITTATALLNDKMTVRVKFRTGSNTNPNLFLLGVTYEAKVTGPADLATANNANVQTFIGATSEQAAPYAYSPTAGENATVVVHFSEPVKNIKANSFTIRDTSNRSVPISWVEGDEQIGSPVDKATLYLGAPLASGQTYYLNIVAGITDAIGWTPLKPLSGNTAVGQIVGYGYANVAPSLFFAYAPDKYAIQVYFNEPVNNMDDGPYTLVDTTANTSMPLNSSNSTIVANSQQTYGVIYLFASDSFTGLIADHSYKITYNTSSGHISDKQGLALSSGTGVVEQSFQGNGAENARPTMTGVLEAKGTTIKVQFSEDLQPAASVNAMFTVRIEGNPVAVSNGTINKNVVTLTVPNMAAGKIGDVQVNGTGMLQLKDWNRQTIASQPSPFQFVAQ
ncbi:MAG: Ig-like domain-containing protein [Paenibacillaceae bacterium]|nr:Ig-like domain-containing protein [Paenibacillaceae bacterium]